MDMYPKYKSPLGYSTGDNNIDAYGVDHSGFSNQDELEYQFARQAKENQNKTEDKNHEKDHYRS